MPRTIDERPSSRTAGAGRRISWWGIVMLAALAAVVAPSCGDGNDAVDTATGLADTWIQAWNETDPELMGSVFTADGVYDDGVVFEEPGRTFTRDETIEMVETVGSTVMDVRRVGELTETDDETFTFVCEFTVVGSPRSATVEIELEGDLASRIEFLSSEVVEG